MSGILGGLGPPFTKRRKPGFWSTLRLHADKPKRERLLRACESFFWNTLCCRPDGGRLHSWWYHHTGNAARFFHRRHCAYCLDSRSRPWVKP